jgi:hypothetical protein
MAIARKGSRLIVVAGVGYRWAVTGRRDDRTGVVVELADRPAGLLIARAADMGVPVVPAMVALGIRRALDEGWDPHASGPPYRLGTALDALAEP